ncbi:calsequestrin-1-like [Paramacrobiotus metropolitanus]|uniref:calsequestrin-1-like n=1 Tax=Paramacrobiotus metropolitanus TaxID=2943436 RepID=UPI0024462F99|nr:calsequestrin-1-like [Paramacrobiotus metropolitanus]
MNIVVSSFIFLPAVLVCGVPWTEFPVSTSANVSRHLHSLTPSSFVSFLKSNKDNISVVWFHPKNISQHDRLPFYLMRESFLVPAADRLRIPIAEFPITNESLAVTRALGINETSIDTIHIYSRLRRIVYYGLRTSDALVSYVKRLQCPKFTLIEGKADKKQFDLTDKIRVLAYVVPGSAFARVYANASLAFGPAVKFFVIISDAMAVRYGLVEGKVQVHRPGEMSFAELQDARSANEIIDFVREEAGKSYFQTHRLTSENIYSFWREKADQPKFVLLTSASHTPHASRFHKLLRRSILNSTECQISVIDVDQFPGMAEYWRRYYRVDPISKPVLGYVALHNSTAIWLDERHINSTEGKDSERQNERAISDFVGSILNGTVTLKHGKQIDPETGVPTSDGRRDERIGQGLEGQVVDLNALQKETEQTRGKVEHNVQDGWGDDASGSLLREGKLDWTEEEKPYFGKAERDFEPVRYENPAKKFEHDLTSFGSRSHLESHAKKHSEL